MDAKKLNEEKYKVMVFNKTGKLLKYGFSLGEAILENVKSYNCLGLTLTPNCSFNLAINTLDKKTQKARLRIFEFQWRNELNRCPDPLTGSGNKVITYFKLKATLNMKNI